tara:strand:- start:10995 stop:11141 length:147 start_codon:yes stop_codon:yes gene_type:complete
MEKLRDKNLEELIQLKENYLREYMGDTQRPWNYYLELERIRIAINEKQ